MRHRRSGSYPGRRFALALALSLASVAGPQAAAVADAGGPLVTATVYSSGGATVQDSMSLAALQADPQRCPAYSATDMTEYRADGSPTDQQLARGGSGSQTGTWTLSTILGCMQTPISATDVTAVTVLDDNGAPQVAQNSQLSPADLASPSDFQNPSEAPVVSDLGSSVQYNRPWRGSGDANASDQVTTGAPLTIEVYEGPPLTVHATASPSTVATGTSVSFSATVTGNQGSPLSYHWSFGDNLPDSASSDPRVSFADAGTHTASLVVTDADGGGGGTTVPITVTASSPPPPAPSSSPTPPAANPTPTGNGNNPHGGAHPAHGNGKGNGKQPATGNGNRAKRSGGRRPRTSPGPSHPQPPSSSGGGSGGSGGSAGSGGSSGSGASVTTPSTSPSPSSPTPSPPSSPPTRRVHPHQAAHRAPTHRRTSPPDRRAGPRLVSGLLISDVTPLPASASPLVQRQPGSAASAPALRPATDPSPVPLIAGVLAILALLGLGARRELRGPGGWRALRLGG